MVLKLGIDVLWTYVFPLLELKDLYNLYLTHPDLKDAISEYKDWDQEYQKLFDCDYTEDSSSGLVKVFMRLNAVPYSWGVYTASACRHAKSDTESSGFLKVGYSPTPIKCSVGAIRQYMSDRSVLLCNGKVFQWSKMYQPGQKDLIFETEDEPAKGADAADDGWEDDEWGDDEQEYGSVVSKTPGAWAPEIGWPDFVHRLYPNNYEVHTVDGSRLFHQQPTAPSAGIEFNNKVLWASFAYSKIDVLLENRGLVTGMEFFHPDGYSTIIDERNFPEPMQSFCVVTGVAYALLSHTGKVYTGINNEVNPVCFPCAIKSIVSFDLRYTMQPIGDGERELAGWSCWSSMDALNSVGFLALGVDGRVYYYEPKSGVLDGYIPNLENIVKIVSRGTAMLALDKEGQVFFMGHSDAINTGLGTNIWTDIIVNEPELQLGDIETKPDLMSVWLHPSCVDDTFDPADMRDERPYIVIPRRVYIPGRVVDINVYGTQVSALVLPRFNDPGPQDPNPVPDFFKHF